LAYSFQKQVEDGIPFDTMAKRLELRSSMSPFFGKRQPIFGSQYLTDKVFDSKIGEVTAPADIKNVGIIVTQVTEERKEGFSPLEDMKQVIISRLKDIKRLDALKAKAAAVYNKIENIGILESAKNIDPTLTVEMAKDIKNNGQISDKLKDVIFTTKALMLPLNKISEPIRGTTGYIIMQVMNRYIPDEIAINKGLPQFMRTLKKGLSKNDFNTWFTKVKENAEIKDYRLRFYKDY
jgi:hypothetical protein